MKLHIAAWMDMTFEVLNCCCALSSPGHRPIIKENMAAATTLNSLCLGCSKYFSHFHCYENGTGSRDDIIVVRYCSNFSLFSTIVLKCMYSLLRLTPIIQMCRWMCLTNSIEAVLQRPALQQLTSL